MRHFVKELQQQFGTKLSFVFRHYPVDTAKPYAEMAAETSECAAARGIFWQMQDLLYQIQERNGTPAFQELAEALGFDGVSLLRDLELQTFKRRVLVDLHGGSRSGVTSTPAFYINNQRYERPIEFKDMSAAIRSAIASNI